MAPARRVFLICTIISAMLFTLAGAMLYAEIASLNHSAAEGFSLFLGFTAFLLSYSYMLTRLAHRQQMPGLRHFALAFWIGLTYAWAIGAAVTALRSA